MSETGRAVAPAARNARASFWTITRRRLERLLDIVIGMDHILPVRRSLPWAQYVWGALVVALCTEVSRVMFPFPYFELDNVVMIYMLGIVVVAIRYGRGPAILSSVLTVAAINIFFVPRYLATVLAGAQNLITFGSMFIIAVVISSLAVRTKQQAEAARQREQRAAALYSMSGELASTVDVDDLIRVAVEHIGDVFNSLSLILLPNQKDRLLIVGDERMVNEMDLDSQRSAEWALDHRQMAGLGTAEFPESDTLYVPLIASRGAVGVLCMRPEEHGYPLSAEQLHLLQTFANQTALAIERTRMSEEAQQAQVDVEAERLRNALLSSVSHDLRTPLTAISGAASTLLESESLDVATRHELVQSIYDEADRLNRLVRNLLDMTRLEAGTVQVHKEWQLIEEVIGVALSRLEKQLADRPVRTDLPPDLPPAPFDAALIEQVLINLLENALKYTPPGSPIDITAHVGGRDLIVAVGDHGPGLVKGDQERIFEKFYRAKRYRAEASGDERGTGLGLTICRGIIQAHGGRIWAENQPEGGAIFRFSLPLGEPLPDVELQAEG
ncbi:MAG TPA: ATP-binding protein [Anaerolineae bacterium]